MLYYRGKKNYDRDYYYMTLDLQRFKKPTKMTRRLTLSDEIRSGYKMLFVIVIALNLVLGATYFMINGQKTVLGYKLKQLQTTNENLRGDARIVDSKIVNATSVKTIEKQAQLHKMGSSTRTIYSIRSSDTAKR